MPGNPGEHTLIIDEQSRVARPYLVIVDGPRHGRRFALSEGLTLLGRAPGADILLDDQSVSRRHCEFTRTAAAISVQDLGSKNGTQVNGETIGEATALAHADCVQAGIYTLRLIINEVSADEELSPPISGRNVRATTAGEPGGDTAMVTDDDDAFAERTENDDDAESGDLPDDAGDAENIAPDTTDESAPRSSAKRAFTFLIIALILTGVAVAGYWAFTQYIEKPEQLTAKMLTRHIPIAAPTMTQPGATPTPQTPTAIPVIVDFAANPLPARVVFQDRDYGLTPVRATLTLDVGKQFTAEGHFQIPEFREEYTERANFTVTQDESLIPVYFRPPIGALVVEKLPKNAELTLNAYFSYDQYNKRTATLADVAYGKPIYLPYGRYEVEMRCPRSLGPDNQSAPYLCYRREMLLTQEAPKLSISVTDDDLKTFPAEIRSTPADADVFIDGKRLGTTPYSGTFPVGEHTLVVRKEGYLESSQPITNEMNTPLRVDVPLKTTPAGAVLNEGRVMVIGGRYKEAIAKLTDVFTKNPTPVETAQANYLLASAFLGTNDFDTAKGYYQKAQAHADYELRAKLGLARIAFRQNDTTQALLMLSDVMVQLKPDDPLRDEAQTAFKEISPLRSVLYIYSTPSGANILVNGTPMKDHTPALLPDLGLGNYKVRLEKEGFQPQEVNINLTVHEFNPVIVNLQPVTP